MSGERTSSLPAELRRTLRAPAAARERLQMAVPITVAAPATLAVRQNADKTDKTPKPRPPAAPAKPVPKAPPRLVPDPAAVARRKERIERHNALVMLLRRRWPTVFTAPRAPWAIGIHAQIIEELGCDKKDLGVVLSRWSHAPRYLKLLAAGVTRRNLDGSEAGEPTAEERTVAGGKLAAIKASAKAKSS